MNWIKKYNIPELLIILLFSYPLFYYSYKFGTPDFGNKDFYDYYPLYKSFDIGAVENPFNMRLISTFFVFIINKSGFFYNNQIAFSHEGIDQSVFFSALFFNYICVVVTCYFLYRCLNSLYKNKLFSSLFVSLYLLGFGIQFYCINTLTESFSILLFLMLIIAYYKKSNWILPLLVLCVFQREYFFFVMGLISFYFLVLKENKLYNLKVLFASLGCFAIYVILRKTMFYTPTYAEQLNVNGYLSHILHPNISGGEYFRQTFLNQNILIFYIGIVGYKLMNGLVINKNQFCLIILLYLQVHAISIIANLSNNSGRYFYTISPLIIFFIAFELKDVLKKYLVETPH